MVPWHMLVISPHRLCMGLACGALLTALGLATASTAWADHWTDRLPMFWESWGKPFSPRPIDLTMAPAVRGGTREVDGRRVLEVVAYARGANGHLLAKGEAGGWQDLGGELTSAPATEGGLVFARGADNQLHHYIDVPRERSGWQPPLGGLQLTSAPAVTPRYTRQTAFGEPLSFLDVFARGPNNTLWHRLYQLHQDEPGPDVRVPRIGGWEDLGGEAITSAPAAVSWRVTLKHPTIEPFSGQSVGGIYGNHIRVFARGANNHLWLRSFVPTEEGGSWSSWQDLGGDLTSGPAVVRDGDSLHVFARLTDNRIWHKAYSPSGGWRAWESLGLESASAPAAVLLDDIDSARYYGYAEPQRAFHVFARGPDNDLLHAIGPTYRPVARLQLQFGHFSVEDTGEATLIDPGADVGLRYRFFVSRLSGHRSGRAWELYHDVAVDIPEDPFPVAPFDPFEIRSIPYLFAHVSVYGIGGSIPYAVGEPIAVYRGDTLAFRGAGMELDGLTEEDLFTALNLAQDAILIAAGHAGPVAIAQFSYDLLGILTEILGAPDDFMGADSHEFFVETDGLSVTRDGATSACFARTPRHCRPDGGFAAKGTLFGQREDDDPGFTVEYEIVPASLPEFAVLDLFTRPEKPAANQSVELCMAVRNRGPVADGRHRLTVYVDGALNNVWSLTAGLGANEERVVCNSLLGFPALGPHQVTVIVDEHLGEIVHGTQTWRTETFTWAKPDLRAGNLEIRTDPLVVGQPAEICLPEGTDVPGVTNIGGSPAGPFHIHLEVGAYGVSDVVEAGHFEVPGLQAFTVLSRRCVTFTLPALAGGDYLFRLVVDPHDDVDEALEGSLNNIQVISRPVQGLRPAATAMPVRIPTLAPTATPVPATATPALRPAATAMPVHIPTLAPTATPVPAATATPAAAPAQPDLVVSKIEATGQRADGTVNCSQSDLFITVRNAGDASASLFRVSLLVNGKDPLDPLRSIESLDKGAETRVGFSFRFLGLQPGSNVLRVTVDSRNQVAESNEQNNVLESRITCQ